ncbi:MAG: metal ABC transporter permease [Pseudomonadota bacterium]
MDVLLAPFNFEFMQRAFAMSLLAAIPTALLSCFLVVRGWALLGDAVSHSVLPGVVLAYMVGIPLLLGAFGAAMLCALASGYLSNNSRIKPDTAMGVVFSGMFGLGIVLYTAIETDVHLDHILFGNLLGVETHELWTSGLIGLAVVTGLLLFWRDLRFHSFDPAQAQLTGLPVNTLYYGLLSALSLTIVATLSATGLILAIGLLIAPGAIAFLVTRTLSQMMIVSVSVCVFSMVTGVYLSYFLDSAPAPTAILVFTILFIIVFITKQVQTHSRVSAVIQRIT